MLLQEKEHRLENVLANLKRVAIAFSGGADSSLLVSKAIEVLGEHNVLLLTARSCLLTKNEIEHASSWLTSHGHARQVQHEFVDLQPLDWVEFVQNPPNRCYLCKSRVYSMFKEVSSRIGFVQLIDGTNHDDMHSDRPGLKALRELDIGTPLAEAELTKNEVRCISKIIGLDTWDRPSGSCLATRIPHGLQVTVPRLEMIAQMESQVESLGFKGCRVKLDRLNSEKIYMQVCEKDVARAALDENRSVMMDLFNDFGVKRIFLDMKGR